jgi:hypothetical protein
MSQYERRRRSNVLSGDGSRLPNGGNTRVGQRGSGHLAAFSVCLGGRLDKTGTHANDGSRGEAVGKPGVAGVYTNQRLNLSKPWKGLRMTCQGFKPDPGNLAVRHYRGASRNVRHGETVNPPAIERAGSETPHLQQGALDLYPNRRHHSKPGPRLDPTRPTRKWDIRNCSRSLSKKCLLARTAWRPAQRGQAPGTLRHCRSAPHAQCPYWFGRGAARRRRC